MARKLFISVLGTGLYEKSVYTQGDFKSNETRFIQQATLELIGCKENWTEEDRVCILLTDKGVITQTSTYKGRNSLRGSKHLTPKNELTTTDYACFNLRWKE